MAKIELDTTFHFENAWKNRWHYPTGEIYQTMVWGANVQVFHFLCYSSFQKI